MFKYILIANVSKFWRNAGMLFRCNEIEVDITSITMQQLEGPFGVGEQCKIND